MKKMVTVTLSAKLGSIPRKGTTTYLHANTEMRKPDAVLSRASVKLDTLVWLMVYTNCKSSLFV